MRWIWIDRFVEFQSGSHARAIKNISLAEEHLHDHFPGFPVMPGSLIIEGLAQTGGILLGEMSQFKRVVVLAKVPNAKFHSWALPGDRLDYHVRLLDAREDGGIVECTAKVGDRLVAEAEIMFGYVPQEGASVIDQQSFVFTMRLLGVFDVGRAGDGSRIEPGAAPATAGSSARG